LLEKIDVGKRVIVLGGGFVGCEVADYLREKGKEVTIIEVLSELASELYSSTADQMVKRLEGKGVKAFTGVKSEEITDKGMEIVDRKGRKVFLEADNIVICTGSVSDKTLLDSLKGKVQQLFEVGDCAKPRRIQEAIYEGAEAGLRV